MNQFYLNTGGIPSWLPVLGILIPIIIVWTLFWKGLALWHSARRGQYWWFLILLVINTMGILEIVYLFAVAKIRFDHLFLVNSEPDHSSAPPSTASST